MTCCAKPVARIIKIGDVEAGLMGLDDAFRNVLAANIGNEDELARTLLAWLRKCGNYVAPSREEEYKKALLREYKAFEEKLQRPTASPPGKR